MSETWTAPESGWYEIGDGEPRRLTEAEYRAWVARCQQEIAGKLSEGLPDGLRLEWVTGPLTLPPPDCNRPGCLIGYSCEDCRSAS